MPPTIALTMMLRDEAAFLPEALAASEPFCDEFIAGIDETSTDDTEVIAREFLRKVGRGQVFKFKWPNHFSEARNAVLDKATTDWIVNIDGHEIFRPGHGANLRRLLSMPEFEKDVDFLEVLLQMDEFDHNYSGYQPHVFRNLPEIRFRHQQHNKLPLNSLRGRRVTDLVLDHKRTKAQHEKRFAERLVMTHEVMEGRLEKDPKDAAALYYLASTLEVENRYEEAEAMFIRLTELGEPANEGARFERTKVWWRLGCIAQMRGDWDIAATRFMSGFMTQPDIAENMVGMADVFEHKGETAMALHWLRMATVCRIPEAPIFFSKDFYTWIPLTNIAQIHERHGNWHEAIEAAKLAIGTGEMPEERAQWLSLGISEWGRRLIREDVPAVKQRAGGKPNIAIFDATGQFTKDLAKHWAKSFNVRVEREFKPSVMAWADIAWFEWCDQNIVAGSAIRMPGTKVVCRLHRYEQFTGIPAQVRWENVDTLICIEEHVRKFMRENYGISAEVLTVRNGVDLEKFTLMDPPGYADRVAFVGYLNERKGVRTMLDLAQRLPGVEFHVLGEWQDAALKRFCLRFIDLNALSNVTFYKWTDDVNGWFEAVRPGSILSLSTDEGCHYSVLEAMAKGIRPFVLNWAGASDVFPPYSINWNVASIEDELRGSGASLFKDLGSIPRDWIKRFYSLKTQLDLTDIVLSELLQEKAAAA